MGQANGWTDGQTLDRYIDPAPHAMQAASITQKTIMLAAITQPLTCVSTNNIRYLSIGIQQYITCVVPISRSQLVNQERMRPVEVVPRSEAKHLVMCVKTCSNHHKAPVLGIKLKIKTFCNIRLIKQKLNVAAAAAVVT